MRPESDEAREEFRLAEIFARIWLGQPVSQEGLDWARAHLKRQEPRWVVVLGTEGAARRRLLMSL